MHLRPDHSVTAFHFNTDCRCLQDAIYSPSKHSQLQELLRKKKNLISKDTVTELSAKTPHRDMQPQTRSDAPWLIQPRNAAELSPDSDPRRSRKIIVQWTIPAMCDVQIIRAKSTFVLPILIEIARIETQEIALLWTIAVTINLLSGVVIVRTQATRSRSVVNANSIILACDRKTREISGEQRTSLEREDHKIKIVRYTRSRPNQQARKAMNYSPKSQWFFARAHRYYFCWRFLPRHRI